MQPCLSLGRWEGLHKLLAYGYKMFLFQHEARVRTLTA